MSTLVFSGRLAMRASACGFAWLDVEGGNFGYWKVRNIGRIVGMRTLVLSRRRMNWKFDFSPETSDIVAVDERCYCWRREYNQIRGLRMDFGKCEVCAKPELIAHNSVLASLSTLFALTPDSSFTLNIMENMMRVDN